MYFPFGVFLAFASLYQLIPSDPNEPKKRTPKNAPAMIIKIDFACPGPIPIVTSAVGFCIA